MANKAIVATKVGMTQLWDDENRVVPVTMLRVTPCRVVQVKTDERDGYSAVQVTFGQRDERKLTRPEAGHFASAGVDAGDKLVVVDFTATWCGPCQRIPPVFAKLAEEMPDIVFVKVDVDENEETAGACGIQAMPTFQFYKTGAKAHEFSGASEEKIREAIEKFK